MKVEPLDMPMTYDEVEKENLQAFRRLSLGEKLNAVEELNNLSLFLIAQRQKKKCSAQDRRLGR